MLAPNVVLRIDAGTQHPAASLVLQGAAAVARQTGMGLRSSLARPATHLRRALVNGSVGVVVTVEGQPMTIMGFTVAEGKIIEIDAIADPARVRRIAAAGSADA